MYVLLFFFNDTATTEIYTLSLHDALPISAEAAIAAVQLEFLADRMPNDPYWAYRIPPTLPFQLRQARADLRARSEEHTSELQSRQYLVCRLLLEKKQTTIIRCLLVYS